MEEPKIDKPLQGGTLQVSVQTTRGFHVRLWIGMRLLRLAGWVMGGTVEINESRDA